MHIKSRNVPSLGPARRPVVLRAFCCRPCKHVSGSRTWFVIQSPSNLTFKSSIESEVETEHKYEPLKGRFSYKQLRTLPRDQLKHELSIRNLATIGYRIQLAGRLYQAFLDEGRGINSTESAEIDSDIESHGEDVDDDVLEEAMNAAPLLRYQKTITGKLIQEDSEAVMSNKTGAQVTFMTTQTAPNGICAATSAALRTLQSVWLFECGEDTQRSLLGHPLVDWKRIDRIFVSSMTPEAVLGLPGMLCTISASRERGHQAADIPVHVYGPPGLVQFVASMLSISRTYLEMPVILHEFTPRAVPREHIGRPVEVLRRSRLYAMALPPDQLNPDGYYDGQMVPMLARHTRKRSGGGADLRSGMLPQELPPPGDPTRQVPIGDMKWTILADSTWVIKASPLKNKVPAIGYLLQESDRAGRLYPAIAQALGVTDSDLFTTLKSGTTVEATDGSGRLVRPEQCVCCPRPGRKIALVGPCTDSLGFARSMGSTDVLVHSMVSPSVTEGESATGASGEMRAPEMAGKCAAAMNASELILWEPLTSFLDSDDAVDEEFPLRALGEARESFGREYVSLAGSYRVHLWDRDPAEVYPPEVPEELRHLIELTS